MLIIDDFSRYIWIFFLKNEDQTCTIFQSLMAMVERRFDHKIRAVQTDGGGKFHFLTSKLSNVVIIHCVTCPHNSKHNGYV